MTVCNDLKDSSSPLRGSLGMTKSSFLVIRGGLLQRNCERASIQPRNHSGQGET
jgi:hypothetical protein